MRKYEIRFRINAARSTEPGKEIYWAAEDLLKREGGPKPHAAEVEARALMMAQVAYLDLCAKEGRF